MVFAEDYLATVRDRLLEDGGEVTDETIGPLRAMVGYRSNVKALSKMHLFTAVASVPEVDEATMRDFARQVSDYAKSRKGRRGRAVGVVALATLVAPKVDSAAKQPADEAGGYRGDLALRPNWSPSLPSASASPSLPGRATGVPHRGIRAGTGRTTTVTLIPAMS